MYFPTDAYNTCNNNTIDTSNIDLKKKNYCIKLL